MRHKGFTLIELVMVIVIIGILAVLAIPKFIDLANQATCAAEQGTVGAVRAGLYTYYAQNRAFPTLGACTASSCFTEILSNPSRDWGGGGASFTGPTGCTYTYAIADGSFVQASCSGATSPCAAP